MEALAEPTRLRLAALMAETELTVTELTSILGQSQPRVSRHLKLMVDAGLVERHREGAWAFFRLRDFAAEGRLAREVLAALDSRDAVLAADRARLAEVRAERSRTAEQYFSRHAADWNRIRSLHVSEAAVEEAVLATIGPGPYGAVVDLGTGTGRMLELLAPRFERAVGLDASPSMLAVARANLERAGLRQVQLRHGDIYALPLEHDAFDVVIIHQVLHFLDDPARALREAARVVRPGGRIIVVDFAPHDLEFLRAAHAHRRLGFSADEVSELLREVGLAGIEHRSLAPATPGADQLTVSLWVARDPRIRTDINLAVPRLREIA